MKFIVTVFLIPVAMVFFIQNVAIAEIRLAFWQVQAPRAIVTLVSMAVGTFPGILFWNRDLKEEPSHPEQVKSN